VPDRAWADRADPPSPSWPTTSWLSPKAEHEAAPRSGMSRPRGVRARATWPTGSAPPPEQAQKKHAAQHHRAGGRCGRRHVPAKLRVKIVARKLHPDREGPPPHCRMREGARRRAGSPAAARADRHERQETGPQPAPANDKRRSGVGPAVTCSAAIKWRRPSIMLPDR